MPLIHEPLLGLWIVNQQEIGIAAPRSVQSLARTLRDDLHEQAGPVRELRQDMRQ